MKEVLIILLAYLIGSIPTAVWVSKYFFNIDIREYGSGNAGATNTFRVLGKKWGTFVMVADMLKGLLLLNWYSFFLIILIMILPVPVFRWVGSGSSIGSYLSNLGRFPGW